MTGKHFFFNTIQDGLFGALHVWGGTKKTILPKICQTYLAMTKLGKVIPDLTKIPKIYKSRDTHLELCWYHHFFSWNQQILVHQKIQIYIAFWVITFNFLNFFWVFKDFFHKLLSNFDNISKNGYSEPSQNKKYFKPKAIMMSQILSTTSLTKIYHLIQVTL